MKSITTKLLIYEFIKTCKNPTTIFFSLIFPIGMFALIASAVTKNLSGEAADIAKLSVLMTTVQIIPLALGLMSVTADFAQEVESNVPFRLKMFHISEASQLAAKIIVMVGIMTISYILYITIAYIIGVHQITFTALLIVYIVITLELAGAMIISFSLSILFKKFGPAFAIAMALYFFILLMSGMMGLRESDMPQLLATISRTLPFPYISNDFYKLFTGQSYNFVPFIQAMIFYLGLSVITCAIVIRFRGAKMYAN